MEKEVKRLKADVRRLRRIVKVHEKSDYLVDRVVAVVRDAVESVPNIAVPQFSDVDGHSDETVLLHISDSHVGKKTKSYNPRVFEKRLVNLFDGMMRVVTIQRSVRPLKDLVIVMNGDKQSVS